MKATASKVAAESVLIIHSFFQSGGGCNDATLRHGLINISPVTATMRTQYMKKGIFKYKVRSEPKKKESVKAVTLALPKKKTKECLSFSSGIVKNQGYEYLRGCKHQIIQKVVL